MRTDHLVKTLIQYAERAYIAVLALAFVGALVLELVATDDAVGQWVQDHYIDLLLGGLILLLPGVLLVLAALSRIEARMTRDNFSNLRQRLSGVYATQAKIVVPEVEESIRQVEHFFENGIFEIRGRRAFQDFWIRAIDTFPGADILATSLPSNKFFWNAEDLIDAMERNVKAKGKVKRLFFLDHDGPPTAEELAVMRAHQKIKVDCFYCDRSRLLPEDRDLVLVDTRLRFGWRVDVSVNDIQLAQIFTRKDDLEKIHLRLAALFKDTDLVHELPAE